MQPISVVEVVQTVDTQTLFVVLRHDVCCQLTFSWWLLLTIVTMIAYSYCDET